MTWVLAIITFSACGYAIYANYTKKSYEICLSLLIRKIYKPKNEQECQVIVEELLDEFDRLENSNH